jgi:hypothetical protein
MNNVNNMWQNYQSNNQFFNRYNNTLMSELTNIITDRINNNSNFFPVSQQSEQNPTYNIANIIQNTLYQKNAYKKVTSDEGFAQIKTIVFKDSEQSTKECSITQDEFTEGQKIIQLPCKHIYEKEAIHTWLREESNSCPICRYELKFREVIQKKESSYEEMSLETDSDTMSVEDPQILQNEREHILNDLNRIIQNIQQIHPPQRLYRQNSFQNTDNDLQQALMASLDEIHDETCDEISYEEKYDDEFLTHPDTQHDSMFDDIVLIDSDDYLNNVD